MRYLRRIFGLLFNNKVINFDVFNRTKPFIIFAMLSLRHHRWLGHVRRKVAFQRICCTVNQNLANVSKAVLILDTKTPVKWTSNQQTLILNSSTTILDACWFKGLEDVARSELQREKRGKRLVGGSQSNQNGTIYICDVCNKDCHSKIGLHSHHRRCSKTSSKRIPSSSWMDGGQ